jgi:hypothetical protein
MDPSSSAISGTIIITRFIKLADVRPNPATPKVPNPENPSRLRPKAKPVKIRVKERNHLFCQASRISLLTIFKILVIII